MAMLLYVQEKSISRTKPKINPSFLDLQSSVIFSHSLTLPTPQPDTHVIPPPLHPSSLRGNLGASSSGLVRLTVPSACCQAELN